MSSLSYIFIERRTKHMKYFIGGVIGGVVVTFASLFWFVAGILFGASFYQGRNKKELESRATVTELKHAK